MINKEVDFLRKEGDNYLRKCSKCITLNIINIFYKNIMFTKSSFVSC